MERGCFVGEAALAELGRIIIDMDPDVVLELPLDYINGSPTVGSCSRLGMRFYGARDACRVGQDRRQFRI
jgi:hypothetical protein